MKQVNYGVIPKPQVEMYLKFWEEISGEKVNEAGLYFTDTKQWVLLHT